ncbi:MAG: hypothetical protein ACE5JG_03815 [Planctomycetota bacterium]
MRRIHRVWRFRWPGVLLAGVIVSGPLEGAPGDGEGSPRLSARQTAALDRAEVLAREARREVLTDDHCPYSPAGVVLRRGTAPEALAAFVRERIGYEPSLGVVRGPEGTLAARAGGDWDRAVLLQALLAEAGYSSRLLVVPRTEEERAAVVDAFLASQGRRRTLGAAGTREVGEPAGRDPLLERLGIRVHNRHLKVATAQARWHRLLGEAYDAGAAMLPSLQKALGGQAVGQPFERWRAALMAGAAERVVVEVPGDTKLRLQVGPDEGKLAGARPVAQVPADRKATFGLAVKMTVAGEGAPPEVVELLNRTFGTGDLFCKPLRLQIAPDGTAAKEKPPNEWRAEEWRELLARFERFQVMLEVDRLWIASDAFDIHGRTFEVQGDGRIKSAKKLGGAIGGGFGGLGGGKVRKEEKPTTRIEALTLELELRLPGAAPVRTSRLIWGDLRRDVSPVYHTDLLVFGGPVGPDTFLWRTFDVATHNVGFLKRILTSDDRYRMLRTHDMRVLPRMLHEWQLARLGIADRILSGEESLARRGGPAIVMKTAFIGAGDGAGRVTKRTVIDVVHDGQGFVPRRAAAADRAARANMLLGAASTVFESLLIRERRPMARLKGAYSEFELAAARGQSPLVARPPDPAGIEPTPLSRWAIAREEHLLVFPHAKEVSAWWSVDPATGALLGRGDGGEGQSLAEYKAALETAMKNLKCMMGAASAMTGGNTGAAGAYDFATCITGFDPTKPSSYAGAYGRYQEEMMGLKLWSFIADRLSTCEDLIEEAQKGG